MMLRVRRIAPLLLVPMLTLSASAETIRRVDDTTLAARLVALRDGNLITSDLTTNAETPIALSDIDEVTFSGTAAARPTAAAAAPAIPPAMGQALIKKFAPGLATAPPPATNPPANSSTNSSNSSSNPSTQSNESRVWQLKLATADQINVKLTQWTAGKLIGSIARGSQGVEIPVDLIREAWCGTGDQIRQAKALNEKSSGEDIAFAARDGKVLAVHGVAKGVSGDALQFKFGDADRNINLNRLVGVIFAKSGTDITPTNGARQAIALTSGDSFVGTWTAIDETTVGFKTTWGQDLQFSRNDVARIKSENGRVVSLTGLAPSSVDETSYFDRILHWQVDHSLTGKPLLLSDGPVGRGIAMHSHTVLTYTLDSGFAEFRSKVGFQQPEGRIGNAVIRVKGDGATLFERADARGDQPPFEVVVKIDRVRQLSIEVDFGNGQDVGDQVVWANPRLVRASTP